MSADFFATLSPGDRIVVRYRLGAPLSGSGHDEGTATAPDGPQLSDAIGHFVSLENGLVQLDARSGRVVIARAGITHAKRVPPPPARRGSRRT